MASKLIIAEHGQGYGPRTALNANSAGLTIAFAKEFGTAGERLTKRVANGRYVDVIVLSDIDEAAEKVAAALREHDTDTVNIAGNGIYTLATYGITQESLNDWVYRVLKKAMIKAPIHKIVSGGQTGADLAGAAVAVALNIDAHITLPKGFLQRDVKGVDFTQTREQVEKTIRGYAFKLQGLREPGERRRVHIF